MPIIFLSAFKLFGQSSISDEVIIRPNHLEFAQWEINQRGPGEQGTGVVLEGKEKVLGEESMKKWFMNLYASDKISLDRSLRDQRSYACRMQNYDVDLPSASVVIGREKVSGID